jgi:ribosomal-protein-alanine N-acetyltransferase
MNQINIDSAIKGADIVELSLPTGVVRAWQASDASSLALHANDRRIWLNLRDRFPHPYGLADAEAFIAMATSMLPMTFFAIAVGGGAVGGIGYTLHGDVERISAEIGYWLGTAFWGRGIMTSALMEVTRYAFDRHADLRRIYAVPYAWSDASTRVLQKAGYRLEGRMRQSAIKDGKVTDQLMYAILREELSPRSKA